MSFFEGQLRCHGCDFSQLLPLGTHQTKIEYLLESGEMVSGDSATGWCHDCNVMQIVESPYFFSDLKLAESKTQSRELRGVFGRSLDSLFQKRGNSNAVADTKNTERLRTLINARKSKPRCLKCGSQAVNHADWNKETFANIRHTCGGLIYKVPENPEANHYSMTDGNYYRTLNLEGLCIKSEFRQPLRKQAAFVAENDVDIAAHQSRKTEKNVDFADMAESLKQRGKI